MMEPAVKVIVSGLDGAGKTSILTALDRKYDFRKAILELKPTIKVEYHQTNFLGTNVNMWDMGGQEKYRELYIHREDVYFDETDLLVYVIDIQSEKRFDESLEYLSTILAYFKKNEMDIPMLTLDSDVVDPTLTSEEEVREKMERFFELLEDR